MPPLLPQQDQTPSVDPLSGQYTEAGKLRPFDASGGRVYERHTEQSQEDRTFQAERRRTLACEIEVSGLLRYERGYAPSGRRKLSPCCGRRAWATGPSCPSPPANGPCAHCVGSTVGWVRHPPRGRWRPSTRCKQVSWWGQRGRDPGNAGRQSADVHLGHASRPCDRRRSPRVGSCMNLRRDTRGATPKLIPLGNSRGPRDQRKEHWEGAKKQHENYT